MLVTTTLEARNIDWDIVEKLLIPQLKRKHKLASFPANRSTQDHRWRSALAKLKHHAEEAKISVSRAQQPAEIWVEGLCEDDQGNMIDFAYELRPVELQQIIEPWITQSINLCKKASPGKGSGWAGHRQDHSCRRFQLVSVATGEGGGRT